MYRYNKVKENINPNDAMIIELHCSYNEKDEVKARGMSFLTSFAMHY